MILLYSTNVYLKLIIQKQYRADTHYVWCSESFDSKKLAGYVPAANVPPSSNPVDIYRQLLDDVKRKDHHSGKIAEQKLSLSKRAVEWAKKNEITSNDKDDILYMIKNADITDWRPLIYVIPAALVQARLAPVAASKRAGIGMEYTISDLKGSEFDIIEV